MTNEAQLLLNRLIAIDTEYHTDALGRIDKVYCIAATRYTDAPDLTENRHSTTFKAWLTNYSRDNEKRPEIDSSTHSVRCEAAGASMDGLNILDQIKNYFNIQDPIFVCHAMDLAERRALKFLGVDCSQYDFICTFHLAKMLQNTFSKASARLKNKQVVFESDTEAANVGIQINKKKESELSYAGLCTKYKLALVDTKHKQAMRKLCIDDTTEGYEQQIMDYCASDVEFLIPLFRKLFNEYYKALKGSFCPMRPGRFDNITPTDGVNYLIKQARYINLFGAIADNGLPIDAERVAIVKKNAPLYRERLKREFNESYNGCFVLERDGLLHEKTAVSQRYLSECVQQYKIKNYPRTNSGKLSMSSDVLKEYFAAHKESFGWRYLQLNKIIRKLNVVSKSEDNPFNYIDENNNLLYDSLKPYGTITSRCTPSTKRFLFGWHKSLYGVLNPQPGKWLVELDYGSEETFIQVCICNDHIYNDIYNSKDIYLAFAHKMHFVSDSDWNNLDVDQLKDKYDDIRKQIKTLILGLSYGMGAEKLASRLGVELDKARYFSKLVDTILHKSSQYKAHLRKVPTRCKAFSLPDGFICKRALRADDNNATTIINWPFQSGGGMILRALVDQLTNKIRNGLNIKLLATIHDAVFFEVDEGDYDSINKVAETMRYVANKALNAPKDWTIKVGAPEIIKNGSIWCTDKKEFVEQFKQLLNEAD